MSAIWQLHPNSIIRGTGKSKNSVNLSLSLCSVQVGAKSRGFQNAATLTPNPVATCTACLLKTCAHWLPHALHLASHMALGVVNHGERMANHRWEVTEVIPRNSSLRDHRGWLYNDLNEGLSMNKSTPPITWIQKQLFMWIEMSVLRSLRIT